ncbi:MAG: DUF3293 domain-containing protein [Gluconacetobacter diazotrophicus]|nr:DUF3293 domain-containing protein [Gluconacetobacter diazotrophicus]
MSGFGLPPTPAVLRSYRLSRYAAGPLAVRIGRRPAGLPPGWERRDVVLLSAANPGGARRPDGWNARMMRTLAVRLRRHPVLSGEGRLGTWSEPLVAAAMPAAAAIVLARRYRQNAVVLLRGDRPARLLLLVS